MTATKARLAAELRAASRKFIPQEVEFFEALAKRAETGEFDDYADVHVCGPTALYTILKRAGFDAFANRVANGEFDASREESEAWARSQTDPEIIRMMQVMGIGPDRGKDQ